MLDWRHLGRRLGVALNLRDPPSVPPHGWAYLDHVVAVYVNLNVRDARADAVILKSRDTPDDLTWGDIFLFESIVFSLQPDIVVCRSAWILRERFREMAGPAVYARYENSGFPTSFDTPEKVAAVRADLTRVLDALHWCYALIPLRERRRAALTKYCFVLVWLYTAALGLLLAWCSGQKDASVLAMVAGIVYAGIMGGFVSSQRRMQNMPVDGDPIVSVFGLDSAGYYLWLSPLLGAIFAVALSLMFAGGFLKGAIFPEFFSLENEKGVGFFDFARQTLPTSSAEYAKLVIWAFIAGFAERLVPDSLDRLGGKLAGGANSPASGARGGNGASNGLPLPVVAAVARAPIDSSVVQAAMHTGVAPAAQSVEPGGE